MKSALQKQLQAAPMAPCGGVNGGARVVNVGALRNTPSADEVITALARVCAA